jgi:hypothetical protein
MNAGGSKKKAKRVAGNSGLTQRDRCG